MNIAYLIQCHKNFEQVILLVKLLELSARDYVVIHVDAKNVALKNELDIYFKNKTNVTVIRNPVSVFWSGISQIQATVKMIGYLYDNYIAFDYCCLLSGEDIPLDVRRLKTYLSLANYKSFIEFRNDRSKYLWRINRFNLFRNNRFSQKIIVRLISAAIIKIQLLLGIKRNNFSDEEIFLGGQWFTISKPHLDMVHKFVNGNSFEKFKLTSCCDEHFFQIFFKKNIRNNEFETFNLRFVDFGLDNNSPKYLLLNDLKKVKNIEHVFFARKVSYDVMLQYFYQHSDV